MRSQFSTELFPTEGEEQEQEQEETSFTEEFYFNHIHFAKRREYMIRRRNTNKSDM